MNGWRRAGTIATAACGAWLAVSAGGASAAVARPEAPTHAMVLDSVATTVAGDLLRDAPIPAGRAVTLLTPIRGDTLGALAQRIVQRLKDQGREVRLFTRPAANAPTMPPGMAGVPAPDSSTFALDARVDGWSVSYVRRIRSFPFGVKGYERVVSMHAGATLTDAGTGAVVWVRTGSGILRDVVPKSDLAYVAGGAVGIDPPLPTGSGFRFLEPLIVLGVVTGLVVLFYSNRN
ncbi:MAG TPA: hypothetical protein VF363_12065 [Candidatus Eisenbacteria bacterium]